MKKLIGVAVAAGATMLGVGAANAEVSANVSLTTDYMFRGVSLTDGDPAIQGGFDWNNDMLYAGVWGSSLSEGTELDIYGGFTPTTGPISWDIGLVGYFYPGADDDGAEFDYWEGLVAGEFAMSEQVALGAAVYYAPENYGDTGEALYAEINATFTASDALSFDAHYGNQSVEDPDGAPGGADEDDYDTWNLGGTLAMHGFSLDLRYHDNNIGDSDDIAAYTTGPNSYDSAVVFTIGREL